MNRYFVTELYPEARYTAGVLREDIETVLMQSEYKSITTGAGSKNLFSRLLAYRAVRTKAKNLQADAIVFFHFPLRSRVIRYFFERVKRRGISTIAYIHDFEGLRDQDKALLQEELKILTRFDIIIAQNAVMKDLIEKQTGHQRILELEMYDYLNAKEPTEQPAQKGAIVFAGNLEKAPFVSQLSSIPSLAFHIYGDENSLPASSNIHYKGKTDPRLLPSLLANEGAYGLIWDGSSLQSGTDTGAYLRFNTPHKLALYIMAGLPVIVWKESAMAEWVQRQQIGIAVSSLYDLKEILEKVKESEYRNFQDNMKSIRHKMRDGYYLKQALAKCD